MALLATVTKKSVKLTQPKLYNITFNLVLTDGGTEVLNQDFSCSYKPGDATADRVKEVKEDMQKAVDNYKAEKAIFTAAAMDAVVTNIQGSLSL